MLQYCGTALVTWKSDQKKQKKKRKRGGVRGVGKINRKMIKSGLAKWCLANRP